MRKNLTVGIALFCAFAGLTFAETDPIAMNVLKDIQKGVDNRNQIEDLRVNDDAVIGDDLTVGGVIGVAPATGAASLAVTAGEAAAASLVLSADEGDDAGDDWNFIVGTTGMLTISNGTVSVTVSGAGAVSVPDDLTVGGDTVIVTGAEGGDAVLSMRADQGDDAGDSWSIEATAAGKIAISNGTVAVGFDSDGDLYLQNNEMFDNATDGTVLVYGNDDENMVFEVRSTKDEGTAALVLAGDVGTDNVDFWRVTASSNASVFSVDTKGTGSYVPVMSVTTTGIAYVTGGLGLENATNYFELRNATQLVFVAGDKVNVVDSDVTTE